jgi:hypothetical protein
VVVEVVVDAEVPPPPPPQAASASEAAVPAAISASFLIGDPLSCGAWGEFIADNVSGR